VPGTAWAQRCSTCYTSACFAVCVFSHATSIAATRTVSNGMLLFLSDQYTWLPRPLHTGHCSELHAHSVKQQSMAGPQHTAAHTAVEVSVASSQPLFASHSPAQTRCCYSSAKVCCAPSSARRHLPCIGHRLGHKDGRHHQPMLLSWTYDAAVAVDVIPGGHVERNSTASQLATLLCARHNPASAWAFRSCHSSADG
jgi:hypothetical protein